MAYHEIEDLGRITKLGKSLSKAMRDASAGSEIRTIGYPGGNAKSKVFFLRDDGAESLWFASWPSDDNKNKAINLFGRGASGAGRTLTIDVQFNHGREQFTRRLGGAFLEDRSTGEVVLAHRGIVTLKHRIKADVLFEAMASSIVAAETSEGSKDFLFMASMDAPDMVDDLCAFASNLRETVQGLPIQATLKTGLEGGAGRAVPRAAVQIAPGGGFGQLGDYFSEFSGKRRAFTPKKVYPVCNHGKVLDALEAQLAHLGKTLKSTAVDLAVDRDKTALLFEVKTNAGTQSVYTAIGQLGVHAPSVGLATGKPVVRVLVVPELPMKELADIVKNQLGIRIVTYNFRSRGRITFDGLAGL